jgi:hypothetical protein
VSGTTWLDGAIMVNGATWTLNEYVDFLVANSNAAALTTLAAEWRELVALLQRNEFGHGNLAHGNVIADQEGSLRLVNFDGVWVPRLAAEPPLPDSGTRTTSTRRFMSPEHVEGREAGSNPL